MQKNDHFSRLMREFADQLTHKDMANFLGKSQSTVHNWLKKEGAEAVEDVQVMSQFILGLPPAQQKEAILHMRDNKSAIAWLEMAAAVGVLSKSTVLGVLWGQPIGASVVSAGDSVEEIIERLKAK